MKIFIVSLLLFVAGCSTRDYRNVTVSPHPAALAPDTSTELVRYPEVIRDYYLARYIDPNQPLLLHEAHTVYRVEGLATWNFHSLPGDFILPGSLIGPTNAAFALPPVNDAVIAEINQQHAITRTMFQQAESLNTSLHDFSTALSATRNLVEQNKALRDELAKANNRLDALEAESQKRRVDQSTNADDN